MSHFAKLDQNNMVVFVTVGRQEDSGKEQELSARTGEIYKQTSYNTRCGVYYDPSTGLAGDQSKAFRKNYAGIGYIYDPIKDAFIAPQPFDSWTLNPDSCCWESPEPYPLDGNQYFWDEGQKKWVSVF